MLTSGRGVPGAVDWENREKRRMHGLPSGLRNLEKNCRENTTKTKVTCSTLICGLKYRSITVILA